jgi:hypothetical protein
MDIIVYWKVNWIPPYTYIHTLTLNLTLIPNPITLTLTPNLYWCAKHGTITKNGHASESVFKRQQESLNMGGQSLHESLLVNSHCMLDQKFPQLSLVDQTRTSVARELTDENLHERFLNSHCLIKREQALHGSWQTRIYMRDSSTLIAWLNANKRCMRVDKREFTWEIPQLSLLDYTRTRVAWELTWGKYGKFLGKF